MIGRIIFASVLVVGSVGLAVAQTRDFPGFFSTSISPNQKWVVVNVDSDQEPYHRLLLRHESSGTSRIIYEYPRSVGVIWNPRSTAFIVNDHFASDESKVVVVHVDDPSHIRTITREDLANMTATATYRRSLLENHHVYVSGVRWKSDDAIVIRASGYGEHDRKGFMFTAVVSTRSNEK